MRFALGAMPTLAQLASLLRKPIHASVGMLCPESVGRRAKLNHAHPAG